MESGLMKEPECHKSFRCPALPKTSPPWRMEILIVTR
jgi:hypothetical protein